MAVHNTAPRRSRHPRFTGRTPTIWLFCPIISDGSVSAGSEMRPFASIKVKCEAASLTVFDVVIDAF